MIKWYCLREAAVGFLILMLVSLFFAIDTGVALSHGKGLDAAEYQNAWYFTRLEFINTLARSGVYVSFLGLAACCGGMAVVILQSLRRPGQVAPPAEPGD